MGRTTFTTWIARRVAATCAALLLVGLAAAQSTSLISSSAQLQHNDAYDPVMSADGRYVGFYWYANFSESDVFLKDRTTGSLERISRNSDGVKGNSYSYAPSLSLDVRYVAFSSLASNLVPGDTNGPYPLGHDVFVRDRLNKTTERVSVGSLGQEGNGDSYGPAISADSRYVAFTSVADNLVTVDANGVADAFVHDRVSGSTELVSLDSSGLQANGATTPSSISADGRYVVLHGTASNLVAGDTNARSDVFVRDRLSGTTERVSVHSSGAEGDGDSHAGVISPDGRYVVFQSDASNLVGGDTNGSLDVFLHDRSTGTTERLSVDSAGTQADGDSLLPVLTPDGRFVAFQSEATNLVAGDTNGRWDVFLRDRLLGTTERVSLDSSGAQGVQDSGIRGPAMSTDARYVAFDSRAALVSPPTGNLHEIYLRDRGASASTYCTAGTTSNGCNATVSAVGAASVSAGSGFDVTVDSVEGNKLGILFWGTTPQALPWGAGTSWLCIGAPTTRTGVSFSGGTAGTCEGVLSLDFNAWAAANPSKAPAAGSVAYLQGWFRDPPAPGTTNLSDALTFTVAP